MSNYFENLKMCGQVIKKGKKKFFHLKEQSLFLRQLKKNRQGWSQITLKMERAEKFKTWWSVSFWEVKLGEWGRAKNSDKIAQNKFSCVIQQEAPQRRQYREKKTQKEVFVRLQRRKGIKDEGYFLFFIWQQRAGEGNWELAGKQRAIPLCLKNSELSEDLWK